MPPLYAAEFNYVYLLPFAVFGAFAAIAWVALDWFSRRKPRSEERLEELRDPRGRKREDNRGLGNSDAIERVIEKASPLAQTLKPQNEQQATEIKQRLEHAGFRQDGVQTIYLAIKLIFMLIGAAVGGGILLLNTFTMYVLLAAAVFGGGLFFAPDLVLMLLAKRRKEAIFLGLPDALDLMVVCVEAGLGLDQAMRKVSEEMKKSYRIVAEEFGLCCMQLQMGKARTEVLHSLGERNGVDDLSALASIIIQADKFGSSIAQALRVQSDAMRVRRRQIAEEKAAKTAVKLIFPLVIFIFPGIFVVLVGPAAITMVNEMFPAMSGGK
ncbi:MAG: type II secretion system F family protein [bacterium]|nr:type II secretion system F family protein [bacterium]